MYIIRAFKWKVLQVWLSSEDKGDGWTKPMLSRNNNQRDCGQRTMGILDWIYLGVASFAWSCDSLLMVDSDQLERSCGYGVFLVLLLRLLYQKPNPHGSKSTFPRVNGVPEGPPWWQCVENMRILHDPLVHWCWSPGGNKNGGVVDVSIQTRLYAVQCTLRVDGSSLRFWPKSASKYSLLSCMTLMIELDLRSRGRKSFGRE